MIFTKKHDTAMCQKAEGLEAAFKQELSELYLRLKDPTLTPEQRAKLSAQLEELTHQLEVNLKTAKNGRKETKA